jgi:solute carrier family 45 protein 1/2/4
MTDNSKTPLLGKKPPVSRPKAHRRRSSYEASTYNAVGRSLSYTKKQVLEEDNNIPGLSLLKLLTLTICMAGVQFTCKFIILNYSICFITDIIVIP